MGKWSADERTSNRIVARASPPRGTSRVISATTLPRSVHGRLGFEMCSQYRAVTFQCDSPVLQLSCVRRGSQLRRLLDRRCSLPTARCLVHPSYLSLTLAGYFVERTDYWERRTRQVGRGFWQQTQLPGRGARTVHNDEPCRYRVWKVPCVPCIGCAASRFCSQRRHCMRRKAGPVGGP